MVEARYRGQKVVVVSPDYAEHTKFADHWLAAEPGSDGALAMAMGHVILKEFYVERQVPYFHDYARRFTDLPLLRDACASARTARMSRTGCCARQTSRAPAARPSTRTGSRWCIDARSGEPAVPSGSVGHRYGEPGRWNLRLDGHRAGAERCWTARASGWRSTCRASTSARARAARPCAAACRQVESAASW